MNLNMDERVPRSTDSSLRRPAGAKALLKRAAKQPSGLCWGINFTSDKLGIDS